MKNKSIKRSKCKSIVWGKYLVATFRVLHVSDNKVINSSHIGRGTFYNMKKGRTINAEAYMRLTKFALKKIWERKSGQSPPPMTVNEWKEGIWKIINEEYASDDGCPVISLLKICNFKK